MKRFNSLSFLLLFLTAFTTLTAQQRNITLEDIWKPGSPVFKTERLDVLRSMKNGKEYAVLNYDRQQQASTVDVYDYKTGEKVRTLLNSKEMNGIDHVISYEFNNDETKILFTTEMQPVYRHSSLGTYYVYDINTKQFNLVSTNKIQEPTFSNNGNKIAYGFENNLYIKDLNSGETKQITTDGKKNSIINGITDWVYEEEFAFVRAFEWSTSGDKLAYIKFDETEVPQFNMDVYGNQLYPSANTFKYPKAGEANSKVSLQLYDLSSGKTSEVDLSKYNSYYIPRLLWTKNNDILSVQLANRHQNVIDLVFVDASNNTSKLILAEKDDAYVDVTDNLTFLNDNSFFWTSEKDGWNHIYQYDKNGKLLHQVTKGPWEVTAYYGFDQNTGRVYYQSTENGNINRDVYSILPSGKNKVRLSDKTGTNDADFSADYTYYIGSFSDSNTPYIFTLNEAKTGKVLREIKNNNELKNRLASYKISPKEYSIININGEDLNMYMVKPVDFDETKQYPLFLFQYSGPGSQSVANKWMNANDFWHQLLANDQQIIIACVDGRGTGFKGREFKKMTQKELGKYEVEDQTAVAQKLSALPYIDAGRTGIWGWSYGGFMSSNCLFQAPDTFEMAIAVAPVTSWRFYDSIYTERFMLSPQENPSGYDENSPITHVNNLQGKFLLVHGSADDNVHVQNTMRLIEALVQANKQFDWRIYPDKNHGIYGGNTRLHLYTLMTDFIKKNL
ncbi:S9 family peptidase [Aequorivita sp. SDUM287046]|uniref:S9 family peptidase n=1 Tax=Aequorivita aurantiaca TaxID=3053356 RepID=A0ABT8DFY2_9FLAO|nr:S9 family peptidase [Aequorivita aurantiaca]MDN3724275.1 S9 family peptidase [Aequorivita aurantiaca]